MTRAEILDCLTDRPCDSCKFHESGRCERWDCVFEEKPDDCEDAISRQAVLETFNLSEKTRKYGGDHSGYDTVMLYEVQDVIEDLPPVTPEQKMGHWEWLTEDKYRCSNCNHETRVDECMNKPLYDFCPFCGAKMQEVESDGSAV